MTTTTEGAAPAPAKPAEPQTRIVEHLVRRFTFDKPQAEPSWAVVQDEPPAEVDRLRRELDDARSRVVYLESVFRDLLATVHAVRQSGRAAQIDATIGARTDRYATTEDYLKVYWTELVPVTG